MSDTLTQYKSLASYMKSHHGITPENIDKKLLELKEKFYKNLGQSDKRR